MNAIDRAREVFNFDGHYCYNDLEEAGVRLLRAYDRLEAAADKVVAGELNAAVLGEVIKEIRVSV